MKEAALYLVVESLDRRWEQTDEAVFFALCLGEGGAAILFRVFQRFESGSGVEHDFLVSCEVVGLDLR